MNDQPSKKLSARQLARQALQEERERAKKQEDSLAAVFRLLDERESMDARLGSALQSALDAGVSPRDLDSMTGLNRREIKHLLDSAVDSSGSESQGNSSDEDYVNSSEHDDHNGDRTDRNHDDVHGVN